ncbi:uncharacterized protein FOMMEDRAFT_124970 [Fomitiporia mediterranea MF3/22]|uniref:uncharacterized protein n=1 Tax=Fomitiporia mediterranea (strain MF3/22) TaxID=694068 RepID=UPI0004408C9A|nr:uncharacterized protein FOMMEDRAFT_124970 [Fomitiporia mediterranea MF3/22]EJD02469.1 hypothetical protein FOMMEDRAFT_124970 [Fomitiporia mediterranea MF3/22]
MKDEIRKIKDQLAYTIRSLNLGLQVNTLGIATTLRNHQLSEAEEKALERLWPPENSAYDPSRGCLLGTRRSVLQNVEEWVHSKVHSQQIYWIHGVAGCGKSSVAASVAGALDGQKILSGSFFCKRDIPERRSTGRLLRSLAYFLSRRVSAFRNAVLQQLRDDPIVLDKPLSHQFNVLLAHPLSTVPREVESEVMVVIIIDALDECEDSETTAAHLANIVQATPWLRLIVTSRPNPQIKASMLRIGSVVQECDLFEATTNNDILRFIRNQFNTNNELPNIDQSQIDCLARHASGHFIWIATVLKHISIGGFGKKDLLQQIIDSNPRAATSEQHLDAVYLRVLENACQGSVGIECAVRWVIGLIFAVSKNRPLPSEALHAFIPSRLGATHDELETILGHLGSVLYNDAQTGAIRVCHPSFLDFIGSQDRSGCFSMTTDELEKNMVENCLRIMLDGLKFNICNLETSHLPNESVLDLTDRVNCNISQHLQYSCLYWFTHLSRSQKDGRCEEQVQQALREFLYKTSLLYWLEALSVMSELKVAVITLKDLRYSKCFKNDKELNSIALDLYRFVTAFQEPMAMSAPHIYLSALLWAPVKSMIANRYCGRKFNIRQCILKGVNDHWPTSLHTITTHSPVVAVAYSPDGRHIVSGCSDNTVRIWDAETGAQVGAPLGGHQGSVNSVAYSPDGRYIVSGSLDNTVRIWDAETGAQVGPPLEGHQTRSILLLIH